MSFFGQTPATTTSTGFTFGNLAAPATTQSSSGLTFGSLGTGTAPLGSFGTSTITTASTGFTFGKPGTSSLFGSTLGPATTTTTTSLFGSSTLSLGGAATNVANPLTLGGTGLGAGTGLTTGSIFSQTTTVANTGLGGVDPTASASVTSTGSSNGKTSDSKMVKATPLDAIIVESVEAFKKHVKAEKAVQEEISRLSAKDLQKVQEDIQSMKQLLSILSSGVHRNAVSVEKLKLETTQELKNAEMALRTKDTPPGLQYENTAPTIYFQKMAESFDNQMQTYRKEIEVMEGHLTSLHHHGMSPQELVMLLRKLHETFIALAAQLHQVHERVKVLKDQYLNYRRVLHGDTKNVFESQKVVGVAPVISQHVERQGPSPFTGISSATAAAMASALTRSQQPMGAPPAVGLGQTASLGTSGLFGSVTTTTGMGLIGTQPITALGGSLFGSTMIGSNVNNSSSLGFGATPNLFGSVENKPFQLQKPPQGAKRGKR